MSIKNGKEAALTVEFPGPGVLGQSRKGRRDRKQALKVQLCHAMDEMAGDIKQAVELYARSDAAGNKPVGE